METSPSLEMYRLDIEELTQLISTAKRPNIKRQLEEYKKNYESLLKEEESKLKKLAEEKSKSQSKASESASNDSSQSNIEFQTIHNYALDTSSDDFVKVYLTKDLANLKSIDPKNIEVTFTKRSFDAKIFNWNKKNYRFSCVNLCKDIDPDKSKATPTSSGLVVKLAKANSGDHWDSLEKKKGLLDKNEEDEDKGKEKDPNASLMEMMKDMYQNGDPEMKKMIAEAWTKSQNEQMKDKK